MLSIILAVVAMVFRDSVVTMLTIFQAKGKGNLAGLFGAVADIASALVTLTAAGYVIQHGWSGQAIAIFLAVMITSYCTTRFWTNFGRRYADEGAEGKIHDHPESHVPELAGRIAALERRLDEPEAQRLQRIGI